MPASVVNVESGRMRNGVLARLPEAEFQEFARFLVPMDLPLGMDLSLPDEEIEYAYFPVSGLVSTDVVGVDGESVEVGVLGREGVTGLVGLLGQVQLSQRVMMQGGGRGLRIRISVLREAFLKGGTLQKLVYELIYLQMAQMSQSILCNRMHQVEARLARWLLTSADRSGSEELQLTQEFLAQMLGSRRSTVTVAAGSLQEMGFIEYRRGHIHITDRAGLERQACECYRTVKALYERVLPAAS